MLGNISVSADTYQTWQTVLAILTIASIILNFYRAKKGPNKDEMTFFREEVLKQFESLNNKVDAVKDDVETTTQRLEAHIDRNTNHPLRRRRKSADE